MQCVYDTCLLSAVCISDVFVCVPPILPPKGPRVRNGSCSHQFCRDLGFQVLVVTWEEQGLLDWVPDLIIINSNHSLHINLLHKTHLYQTLIHYSSEIQIYLIVLSIAWQHAPWRNDWLHHHWDKESTRWDRNICCVLKEVNVQSWWDGSAGKGTCCQAWCPEFDPWDLRGGRRANSCKHSSGLYIYSTLRHTALRSVTRGWRRWLGGWSCCRGPVWFPVPTRGGSKPPVISAPGDPVPSSGLFGLNACVYIYSPDIIHIIKK